MVARPRGVLMVPESFRIGSSVPSAVEVEAIPNTTATCQSPWSSRTPAPTPRSATMIQVSAARPPGRPHRSPPVDLDQRQARICPQERSDDLVQCRLPPLPAAHVRGVDLESGEEEEEPHPQLAQELHRLRLLGEADPVAPDEHSEPQQPH